MFPEEPVEVMPVPPLTAGSAVPERVIASVPAAVIGLPATLKNAGTVAATLVTVPPAREAEDVHVVPLEVNTLPLEPGATNVGADAPLPKMTLSAVKVVRLVPPLVTGNAVPERVIAKVPEVVIGLPATLKNAGTVAATLVTVPPAREAEDAHVVPSEVNTLPIAPGATICGAEVPLPSSA